MSQFLKQSTATTILVGPVLDSGGSAVTGAVIGDFNITKNGTTAAMAASATATHSHNGNYLIALTEGNTDTTGRLAISVNNTSYAMSQFQFTVLPSATYDAIVTNAAGGSNGLSTYAGADTSGTTTLLSRLTATRAGYLDNIPAIFSQVEQLEFVDSRLNVNLTTIAGQTANAAGPVTFPGTISSYAGADTSGTTTLLTRIPSALTITTGKVDINDKTGFALSASGLSAISAWTVNLTGSLSGSVGSVVGNVGGNVVGSVGSLTGYTAPDNAGIAAANAKLDELTEGNGDPDGYTQTLTILNSANDEGIEGAKVRYSQAGVTKDTGTANADGIATVTVLAGTYIRTITAGGFDGITDTVVVTADASEDITLTIVSGTPANAGPGFVN